jgi:hypothetical protein
MPVRNHVARFALVTIRNARELSVVRIFVAIAAELKLDIVVRVSPGWDMTLRACNLDVFSSKWIFGCVVLFYSEQRRLPTLQVVAFRTITLFRASVELALMRVRCVTVFAVCEDDFLLKVVPDMTGGASYSCVFSS